MLRFSDDVFDRYWFSSNSSSWTVISTSVPFEADPGNKYLPPSIVMQTAVTPLNADGILDFSWEFSDPSTQIHMYMHFAEVEELNVNQSRRFNIFLNGEKWYGPITPKYLQTTTVYNPAPEMAGKFQFSINRTSTSTHPPLINALEFYTVKRLLEAQTNQKDGMSL